MFKDRNKRKQKFDDFDESIDDANFKDLDKNKKYTGEKGDSLEDAKFRDHHRKNIDQG